MSEGSSSQCLQGSEAVHKPFSLLGLPTPHGWKLMPGVLATVSSTVWDSVGSKVCTCISTSASKLQVCVNRGLTQTQAPVPPPKGFARSVAGLAVAWDMFSTLQEVLLTISCSKDVSPALPRLYARHRLSWSRYLRPQHTFPPSPWTQLTLETAALILQSTLFMLYQSQLSACCAQRLSLQKCSSNDSLLRSCSPASRSVSIWQDSNKEKLCMQPLPTTCLIESHVHGSPAGRRFTLVYAYLSHGTIASWTYLSHVSCIAQGLHLAFSSNALDSLRRPVGLGRALRAFGTSQ